jgi:hypothetical protein
LPIPSPHCSSVTIDVNVARWTRLDSVEMNINLKCVN